MMENICQNVFYKSTGDTKKMDYISYYLHALFKIWKELKFLKNSKKKSTWDSTIKIILIYKIGMKIYHGF